MFNKTVKVQQRGGSEEGYWGDWTVGARPLRGS